MNTAAIRTAQSAASEQQDRRDGFDINAMAENSILNSLLNWMSNYPQREFVFLILRTLFPILKIRGWAIVSRNEDVREVLTHQRDFPVSWGPKMVLVSGPGKRNFVLGMPDGCEYRRSYGELAKAFPRDEVPTVLAPMAARMSECIIEGRDRLDAIRELMWAVPAQLCEDYCGLYVPDKQLLAEWSIAISEFMFSPEANPSEKLTQFALTAAAGLRQVINDSIAATRSGPGIGRVLPRLVAAGFADDEIVAHMLGMVTGFVPTNLLAAGNILETLLRNPSFMRQTRAAALSNDDELLWRCLEETLRFRYINLGSFRAAAPDGYLLAAGTFRQKTLPEKTQVWALTQSAMFDGRQIAHPRRFDPNRPAEHYLTFGYGQHWCLGASIAKAQLTATFKALLRRSGLRRAAGKSGRLRRIQSFPANLMIEYDA